MLQLGRNGYGLFGPTPLFLAVAIAGVNSKVSELNVLEFRMLNKKAKVRNNA